jgi:hypothetical protein
LAKQAGYNLDLTLLEPSQWIQASQSAHKGEYVLKAQCIQ